MEIVRISCYRELIRLCVFYGCFVIFNTINYEHTELGLVYLSKVVC